MSTPLVLVTNSARLSELEHVIEKGLGTFIEVGAALNEIRHSRLYLKNHATFEDYCRDRWNMTINYANRVMLAESTVENLKATVPTGTPLPTNERQARALSKVEPEDQPKVWAAATKDNPNPTAKQVEESVQKVLEADSVETPTPRWNRKREPTIHFTSAYNRANDLLMVVHDAFHSADDLMTEESEVRSNASFKDFSSLIKETISNLQAAVTVLEIVSRSTGWEDFVFPIPPLPSAAKPVDNTTKQPA